VGGDEIQSNIHVVAEMAWMTTTDFDVLVVSIAK
jgi:hypothetical protein